MTDSAQREAGVQRFDCRNCGATLTFAPGLQQLKCEYCGTVNEIETQSRAVQEHALEELILRPSTANRGFGVETRRFHCDECGGTTTFPAGTVGTECAFCGAEVVVGEPSNPNLVRPETIVPFQISRSDAVARFRQWLRGLWFRPNALKRLAALDEMSGLYTPYFTFDARADSDWRGQAGYYYYVTESYYDPQTKTHKTRRVQRTRWEWRSGHHSMFYDDELVCAAIGLPAHLVRRIEPFGLSGLSPYRAEYLAGWAAEEYSIEPLDAWAEARQRMEANERRACSRELGGDTQRGLNVETRMSQVTFKHLLLPVYSASYVFGGKRYHFLVNGQTGQVGGEAPWSWWKIGGLVLAVAAIVFVLWQVSEGGGW